MSQPEKNLLTLYNPISHLKVAQLMFDFLLDEEIYNQEISILSKDTTTPIQPINYKAYPMSLIKTYSRAKLNEVEFQDLRQLIEENDGLCIAVASFDEEDTDRLSIISIPVENQNRIVFSCQRPTQIQELEKLISRVN